MRTAREDLATPAWRGDELDSASAPEIEASYFDHALDAWILSRHADILAAFQASSLSPTSPNSKANSEPPNESARLRMRAEVRQVLSPAQLRAWRDQLSPEADRLVHRLPIEQPIDLLREYARPVCLSLAAMVTGIPRKDAERLCPGAERVSAAAAEPYNPALRSSARTANAELRSCFHAGPEALRDPGFVALSQTMPCILANAWFALLQCPQQWRLLHQRLELMEQAIEELLRYAGLARILVRTATEDIDLNGAFIRRGERIILRIIAANHDPERFDNPNLVDITRRGGGHFTLGFGAHSCVGASLIRIAASTITQPLLQRFVAAEPVRPPVWQGGSGFRSPASLWVRLSEFKSLTPP